MHPPQAPRRATDRPEALKWDKPARRQTGVTFRRAATALAIALGVAVVGLAPSAQAAPGTVVVAPGQSVGDALRRVAPGGTVELLAGSHRSATLAATTWGSTVTLRPAAGAEGRVSLGELHLAGVQNLTVTGVRTRGLVTIDGGRLVTIASSRPWGVLVKNGASEIDIHGNTIAGGWNGVTVHGYAGMPRPHHVRITGNTISGQENDNVQIGVAHDVLVEDNMLGETLDNRHHNDGVQLMGGQRLTVRGNRIVGGHDQSILLKSEPSLGSDSAIVDAVIEDNLIAGSRELGVVLLSTRRTMLRRNTIYDTPKPAVLFSGDNTGAVVRDNIIERLFVERGAIRPSVQRRNCIAEGATANDIRSTVDAALAASSPCAALGAVELR
jgi:nitrous oxidase accessory protein NosD